MNSKPEFVDKNLSLYKFVSGPYDNNAYLIVCKQTNKSVIIDAPGDPHELISAAQSTDTEMMLITHNHWDHLLGYEEITSKFVTAIPYRWAKLILRLYILQGTPKDQLVSS